MTFVSSMRKKVGSLRLPSSITKPPKWEPPSDNKDSEVEHIFEGTSDYEDESLESNFVNHSIGTKVNRRRTWDAFKKKEKELLVMKPKPVSYFIDFTNKTPREEFLLLLELVKGSLLPRFGKEINPIGIDLFLMEMLFKYKRINLSAIVMEHMNFVINANTERSGLPYGFWMNRVFAYFNI
ncbi:hypothetical protein FXO38_23301 [Capsicum annuum]|nr:hypothetical protein FXO38_23301 [Capsicum annuum]